MMITYQLISKSVENLSESYTCWQGCKESTSYRRTQIHYVSDFLETRVGYGCCNWLCGRRRGGKGLIFKAVGGAYEI